MKRNMDLVRELLLKLESIPKRASSVTVPRPGVEAASIEGHTVDEVWYHIQLIHEKGLIECPESQPMDGLAFTRLTWDGHDFLDSVRDPEIWRKTKGGTDAVGGFTYELMRDLAKGFVKKQLEEYTGVKL